MKLTIVIPALNEEDAIASTIERSLAARSHITAHSPVTSVEIIVVSDGSTDRTAEIASGYDDIRVIVFEKNRGYGAAIKRGFEEGSGDIVGFLDADGTCDPEFFAVLCSALDEQGAAVALGSRLGPDSQMPAIRRLGNRIYAIILSALSNRVVTDTASGMRVLRREVLSQLYPLPDGLHFTPAMSARVLMDEHLGMVERPMHYRERIGESKLNVITDGIRFLRTILAMTLMWRPTRLFIIAAVTCFGLTGLFGLHPVEMWVRTGSFAEDTIYRLLFCSTLGALGVASLSAALLSHHIHRLLAHDDKHETFLWSLLTRLHSPQGLVIVATASISGLFWLIGHGVGTWINAGYVDIHWSRVVLAGLVVFSLAQTILTSMIVQILTFHTSRAIQRTPGGAATISNKTKSIHVVASADRTTSQGQLPVPEIALNSAHV